MYMYVPVEAVRQVQSIIRFAPAKYNVFGTITEQV